MSGSAWLQLVALIVLLAISTPVLGSYMAKVYATTPDGPAPAPGESAPEATLTAAAPMSIPNQIGIRYSMWKKMRGWSVREKIAPKTRPKQIRIAETVANDMPHPRPSGMTGRLRP